VKVGEHLFVSLATVMRASTAPKPSGAEEVVLKGPTGATILQLTDEPAQKLRELLASSAVPQDDGSVKTSFLKVGEHDYLNLQFVGSINTSPAGSDDQLVLRNSAGVVLYKVKGSDISSVKPWFESDAMSFFEGATPALGAVARARMPQSPGFVRTKEFFYVNLDMVAKVDTTPTDDDDDVAQLFDAAGTKIQALIGAEAAALRAWLDENGASVV